MFSFVLLGSLILKEKEEEQRKDTRICSSEGSGGLYWGKFLHFLKRFLGGNDERKGMLWVGGPMKQQGGLRVGEIRNNRGHNNGTLFYLYYFKKKKLFFEYEVTLIHFNFFKK